MKTREQLLLLILYLLPSSSALVVEDDVKCLQGIQESLSNPQGRLSSWTFENKSVGFICSFSGVSCLNDRENRVIRLQLPSVSLSGPIPSSLQFCSSMTNLDFSRNSLSGSIPSSICDWLPYLVTASTSTRSFLMGILSRGAIPSSLSGPNHLGSFSVANNKLSGSIPHFCTSLGFDSSSFDGNSGLCGSPLPKCGGGLRTSGVIVIVASGVCGASGSLLLVYAVRWLFFSSRRRDHRQRVWDVVSLNFSR